MMDVRSYTWVSTFESENTASVTTETGTKSTDVTTETEPKSTKTSSTGEVNNELVTMKIIIASTL